MEWSLSHFHSYTDFVIWSFDVASTSALIGICSKLPICLGKSYATELEANKTETVRVIKGGDYCEKTLKVSATFASAPSVI